MTALPIPPELALDAEPFDLDSLDRALAGPEEHRQPWQITDDGAAQWAMAHLADADAQLRTLSQQATDWSRRIAEWFEQRAKPLERRADFFRGHLHRYALARREAGAGATLTLPSGKVGTLPGRVRVEVDDALAFREWAKANPNHPLVRATYDIAKAEAAKALVDKDGLAVDDQGEVVPGVKLVQGEPTAKVTVL